MTESLGFKWISEQSGIVPVQPFRVTSSLGASRKSLHTGGLAQEVYPAQFRPEPTIPGHLTFALKYEIVHLEFLSRLFSAIEPDILEEWIRGEPTGSFARRAGFLYEWLTGKRLDVPDAGGNYIEALPEDKYLTAARPVNHPRWRVRDNMPGNPDFCPIVYRNKQVKAVEGYDCAKALKELEVEYGADLLMRSAVWLTIKESRASFAIEHEEKQVDRIKRFSAAMAERCGKGNDPLDVKELTDLQTAILGRATRYGLRKSPVFVGHAEAVNVEFENPISAEEARDILREAPGVLVVDKREPGGYVTPVECVGDYATFVSRIREDATVENGLALWIVSDNLRKGAALNAVQIAEALVNRGLLKAAA